MYNAAWRLISSLFCVSCWYKFSIYALALLILFTCNVMINFNWFSLCKRYWIHKFHKFSSCNYMWDSYTSKSCFQLRVIKISDFILFLGLLFSLPSYIYICVQRHAVSFWQNKCPLRYNFFWRGAGVFGNMLWNLKRNMACSL